MIPRREPLVWLQCLSIGAIPLELLLIQLVLAGADPGPLPALERLLVWGVGVVAPALSLWKRPADWGSLLLVRLPIANRTAEQQDLSARQGGLTATIPLLLALVLMLPGLWWLDDSAARVQELSPLIGQSRLVVLLLSTPLLALIVWQFQQLAQCLLWLSQRETTGPEQLFDATQLQLQRTSSGLQILNLPPLDWPAPKATIVPKATSGGAPDNDPTPDNSATITSETLTAATITDDPDGPDNPTESTPPSQPSSNSDAKGAPNDDLTPDNSATITSATLTDDPDAPDNPTESAPPPQPSSNFDAEGTPDDDPTPDNSATITSATLTADPDETHNPKESTPPPQPSSDSDAMGTADDDPTQDNSATITSATLTADPDAPDNTPKPPSDQQ